MTTTNSQPKHSRAKIIALGLGILLIAALIYLWPVMKAYSQTGAAYSARVVCSCRFIGNRDLEDCKKDLEPGMEIVWLSEAEDTQRIDTHVPLLAKDSATFRPGFGCVLESRSPR